MMLSDLQEQQSLCHLALANLETQEWLTKQKVAAPHDPDYSDSDDLIVQALEKLKGSHD